MDENTKAIYMLERIRDGEPWEKQNWTDDAIQAFLIAEKAIRYRTPIRPTMDSCPEKTYYKCPTCNNILQTIWKDCQLNKDQLDVSLKACPFCGQILHWKKEVKNDTHKMPIP